MSSLYDKIDMLCKNNKISVTTLCKETGLSRASLSDLKAGRSKSLSVGAIKKISAHFNAPINFLVGEQPFQYWEEMRDDKHGVIQALLKATNKSEAAIQAFYGPCSEDYSDMDDYSFMRLVSDEIESATPLFDSWVITVEDLDYLPQKNQEAADITANLSEVKQMLIEEILAADDVDIAELVSYLKIKRDLKQSAGSPE